MGYEEEFKEKGFEELANYNKRVSQGIVHTKEYSEGMKELQKEFDEWVKKNEKNRR